MKTHTTRTAPVRWAVLVLLSLALVYCSSSPWSSLSSPWSPSLSFASGAPGGGSLGGSVPFGMVFSFQVKVDTLICDALQFEVKRHEMFLNEYTAHADTILYLIKHNDRIIQGSCTARTRLWFYQPYTLALNALGRYEATVGVLEDVELDSRLSDRMGRALLMLERYNEAEPHFARADSLYSGINAGTLAIMRVNHAWNLFHIQRFRAARLLLDKAQPVLMAACCKEYIIASIEELERLRGQMAGKGLAPPKKIGENSDGHSEIDLMMFVYLAGTIALAWLFGRMLLPRWLHLYRETSTRPSKNGKAKSDAKYQ